MTVIASVVMSCVIPRSTGSAARASRSRYPAAEHRADRAGRGESAWPGTDAKIPGTLRGRLSASKDPSHKPFPNPANVGLNPGRKFIDACTSLPDRAVPPPGNTGVSD